MQFRYMILLIFLLCCNLFSRHVCLSGEQTTVVISPSTKIDNTFKLTEVWHCVVGNQTKNISSSNFHLAWKNNHVFAANRNGIIKALDVHTGKEIWSVDLFRTVGSFWRQRLEKLSSGVTVVHDKLYVGSDSAKVYALNIQDGGVAWMATVSGEALSSPVVSDGLVLIHTGNGMLQAINESDGELKWTINLGTTPLLKLYGESTPAIAFGAAFVGDDNGCVSAILINQGQLIWKTKISKNTCSENEMSRLNDVKTTPVVNNGVVYAAAYNGNLAALELRSGNIIWSCNIGSVNNLLVDGRCLYLIDQDDKIIAVDTERGSILWHQDALLHRSLTAPILNNGYIVTGDSKGYLHWISTDHGQCIARKKIDRSGILNSPIIASDKLIIQAKNGKVYAFCPI